MVSLVHDKWPTSKRWPVLLCTYVVSYMHLVESKRFFGVVVEDRTEDRRSGGSAGTFQNIFRVSYPFFPHSLHHTTFLLANDLHFIHSAKEDRL